MSGYTRWMILSLGIAMVACGAPAQLTAADTNMSATDIGIGKVAVLPVIADLEISPDRQEVTFEVDGESTTAELKARAYGMLLKKTNADVLIEPRFKVTISADKSRIKVITRTAKYKNVRQMTEADLSRPNNVPDNHAPSDSSKKGGAHE